MICRKTPKMAEVAVIVVSCSLSVYWQKHSLLFALLPFLCFASLYHNNGQSLNKPKNKANFVFTAEILLGSKKLDTDVYLLYVLHNFDSYWKVLLMRDVYFGREFYLTEVTYSSIIRLN